MMRAEANQSLGAEVATGQKVGHSDAARPLPAKRIVGWRGLRIWAAKKLMRFLIVGCAYGIPALLVLLTLAVVWRAPASSSSDSTQVPIQIWSGNAGESVGPLESGDRQHGHDLSQLLASAEQIRAAKAALARAPQVSYFSTNRVERPFWFGFQLPHLGSDHLVDFPSRHAVALACWHGVTAEPLGLANRAQAVGRLSQVKSGFVMDVEGLGAHIPVVCRGGFKGPARIEVQTWGRAQWQASVNDYARASGLLDGAGVMLVLFMFAVAVFNREPLYAMLGAWLFGNLRIAAISAGLDFGWLGFAVPIEWLYSTRKFTYGLYYVVTVVVFVVLFRETLTTYAKKVAAKFLAWSVVPVLLAAVLMPYSSFLPVIWVSGGVSIAIAFSLIVGSFINRKSYVTTFFGSALMLTLSGSLAEVVAVATGWRELIAIVNHVSGALMSSLLGAIAVAAHVRRERTQRIVAQKAAIKALDRVRDTYRASPVGLFTLDESARFIRFNPALCRMLGYPVDHEQPIVLSRHFSEAQYEELCSAKFGHAFEVEWLGKNVIGEERAFLVQAAPGENLIEGSIQDVTERRKAVERLRFLAEHDPLTELLNRRGIEQVLEHALMGANAGMTAAIAYVDLDRFKLVNDLYGHAVGDEVLRQVTDRMTRVLKGHCAEPLARVGGDEFVVVFEGVSLKRAKIVCEELLRTIGGVPVEVGQRLVRIEGSIGLCEVAPGVTVHEAIATADRACRQAKQGQPGRLVVYEQAAGAYKDRALELAIIEQLSSSPALPGLFLEMQPIMSLKAPFDSLNFEVLLRMNDANKQLVPTYKVIGALEASGMMPMVDRWVMRQTLSWLEAHAQQLTKTNFVCMNLSGVSLNDERFIADAMDMLADFPLASRMLCLEITESVALRDLNNTRRWIEQLRGHGVKIALDDFGAGYSSFTYLRDLPADSLKIDGAFIKTINHHPANQAIVQVIIELATNLGMRTVAEWAEDTRALQMLALLGAHYAQGWAVAKPQSPEMILQATSAAWFIKDEEALEAVREFSDETKWGKLKDKLFPLRQQFGPDGQ